MVIRTTFDLKRGQCKLRNSFNTKLEEILEAIPASFRFVRGGLKVPEYLLESIEVADSTELVFSISIDQIISSTEEDKRPDIFGILIEKKNPIRVIFGKNFNCCDILSLKEIKKFVLHFVSLGYTGTIEFAWSDDELDTRFCCEISILPYPNEEKLFVAVSYDEDDIGICGEIHRPIIDACIKNGLVPKTEVN